ncbi:pilus assembly protein TadG-related protein [Sandarakinorhabdus rubra]|uniref:pilus assembly protein TadG-related protein n=1 Tax=Sandarakinorhabdus rubra TaxID=2672568 RepID=UPI0038B4AA89
MRFINRLRDSRSGNVAVITAMLVPVMIGAAGLASDTAQWTLVRRSLQRQADSAALAGAYALTQNKTAQSGALADLAKNSNFTLTGTPLIENAPSVGPQAGNPLAVRVRLASRSRLPFSGIFYGGVTVAVEAVAGLERAGDYCIISLDDSQAVGITNSGNTTVDARCGMHANSTGEPAVSGQGSATIFASPVSAVGSIRDGGNFATGTVFQPYNVSQRDPFADLADPSVSGTTYNNVRVQSNRSRSLQPGVYRGGLDIQGTANLADGVYIIDGGSLDIGSQAVVNGSNVTFILTNSAYSSGSSTAVAATAKVNGGATLNITAPDTGTYKGVLVYQDRRTPAMTDSVIINGNSNSRLRGAIYVPKNELRMNGTSGMDIDCLQMVGYRLVFTGNSQIRNICPSGSGSSAIKGNVVRLMN